MIAELGAAIGDWRTAFKLQWGRDQLIAEFRQARRYSISGPWLQWGRDQLIAELSHHETNAARRKELQWGRDQLIAELQINASGGYNVDRFNGAAIN